MVPELLVKEGEDIDYRIVLAFYLLADLGECGHMSPSGEGVGALRSLVMLPPNTAPVCMIVFVACFIFAREEGYWVVTIPFLPLTLWMLMKVPPPLSASMPAARPSCCAAARLLPLFSAATFLACTNPVPSRFAPSRHEERWWQRTRKRKSPSDS